MASFGVNFCLKNLSTGEIIPQKIKLRVHKIEYCTFKIYDKDLSWNDLLLINLNFVNLIIHETKQLYEKNYCVIPGFFGLLQC